MNLLKKKISIPVVLTAITVCVAGATFIESKALYKIDHPTPTHFSCVNCHTDRKTLLAIAEKAADPLYLVKNGDLTEAQLKEYLKPENTAKPLGKGHDQTSIPTY